MRAFVLGLLAELPRKNCWTIAEHVGDPSPDGMQHLLARAKWDADGVRDDLRAYLIEHLGDPGAVLVADETGDVKGSATPGVQRQYTGTAGRVENAQVAVYLGYAAPRGHALIDRELYRPKSWADDPGRCQAAGIPADVTFTTKPQLARRMIERAVTAAVPFSWAAGDEVYGDNGPLRGWLRNRASPTRSRSHAVTGSLRGPDAPCGPMSWRPACRRRPGSGGRPAPAGLIPLTRNEIARLLSATLTWPAPDPSRHLRWSYWRRRHQYRSRTCHYQRQSIRDWRT